jgi:AcrR family transcriptional regulator
LSNFHAILRVITLAWLPDRGQIAYRDSTPGKSLSIELLMPSSRKKKARPGRPRDRDLPARRRSQIIHHAIDEFARNGFRGADLDVIAANAGCSKGTLYNYFSSKGDLFSASVDHVMFSMVEAVDDTDEGDPLERLEQLVRGFLRHFSTYPQYVELLVQERSDFRDRAEPTYYQYRLVSRKRWQKRFATLIEQKRMRPMPADRAINVMSDLLYGTIFMNYFRHRQINPDEQADELLDVLFHGLLIGDKGG